MSGQIPEKKYYRAALRRKIGEMVVPDYAGVETDDELNRSYGSMFVDMFPSELDHMEACEITLQEAQAELDKDEITDAEIEAAWKAWKEYYPPSRLRKTGDNPMREVLEAYEAAKKARGAC